MHSATNLAVVLILSLAGLSVLAQEPTPTLTEAVKILQLEVIRDLNIRIGALETEVQGKEGEAEGLRATIKEQQGEIETIPGLKERLGEQETLTKSLQQKIVGLEKDLHGGNLLVNFMTKVLEESEFFMTSREENISALEQSLRNTVTQKEQYKQDNEACLAHQKTTTETIGTLAEETNSLKNVITLEKKLNASRNTMVTMMSSCKNIPTFTMNMAESLSGQANEIALLKTALEDQAKVEENLEVIKTELVRMSNKISQTDPDCSLLNARNESVTSLLEQQSASLKNMRVVASYSQMAAGSGLRYQEDSSGRLVSASVCQCVPLPDPQCSQPYTTLSDSWRRVVYSSSAQDPNNCDKTLSPGWYRFSFPGQSNGHLAAGLWIVEQILGSLISW